MRGSRLSEGRKSLIFHQEMLSMFGQLGDMIASEFQVQTGLPVDCAFVGRSLGNLKLNFKPRAGSNVNSREFNARLTKFIAEDKVAFISEMVTGALIRYLSKVSGSDINFSKWLEASIQDAQGQMGKG